jgi:hypothetical protein
MKISNKWSIVAFLGLCLGAAAARAQSPRDAEVLVPLAHGVVAAPEGVHQGEVIEELPAIVAPRWSAADEAHAMNRLYWLGFLALSAGTAGAIALRRRSPEPEPRLSVPPTRAEGRISLV